MAQCEEMRFTKVWTIMVKCGRHAEVGTITEGQLQVDPLHSDSDASLVSIAGLEAQTGVPTQDPF